MCKIFLDTEFLEGPQDKRFLGMKYGETKPTIDLISIGMVAEDNRRQYYAVSKDFNLRQAWENEWIRDNVLRLIYQENIHGDYRNRIQFDYPGMQCVLDMVGKSNSQIAQEVEDFAKHHWTPGNYPENTDPEFWAYYADYDWVVFCQLFGRMVDLPSGFPMYCRDLKQLMDDKAKDIPVAYDVKFGLRSIKLHEDYPKQDNEHNALDDARWNKKLYEFLMQL